VAQRPRRRLGGAQVYVTAAGVPSGDVALTQRQLWQRLGAVPLPAGAVEFRVWAPDAARVDVRLDGGDRPLEPLGEGVFAGEAPAAPGDDYRFVLDGGAAWPDPCSRRQPEGVRGPSRVVDTSAFTWTDGGWGGVALAELALYELHVGTFTPEGTFDAVIPRLAALRELGVTAIELMPIATFPGNRGWGYDGLYLGAPHEAYGGPEGLARLVDAAHAEGLGVVLDVVYNHVGPGNEALRAFAPYLTDRYGETPWGEAIDYAQRGVREWALQTAELYVGDYHVDGLRLDAVHAVVDESDPHILAELAERVRAVNPAALVISEMGHEDFRPLEEWGHDAMWLDNLHHVLHVALTGERDGYYARFEGSTEELVRELTRPQRERLVVGAQNHDQVGNRAAGDRLPPELLRIAGAVCLFAPYTPLVFMGEECATETPFQFFTDHIDPFIADATREGRRREFRDFTRFSGDEVPDPQALETFERSILGDDCDAEQRELYRELLHLRRELPRELEVEARGRTLVLRRGGARLTVDLDARSVELAR
jgi:maltooligosyltrehalose trehalohydrolase